MTRLKALIDGCTHHGALWLLLPKIWFAVKLSIKNSLIRRISMAWLKDLREGANKQVISSQADSLIK
ncbi:hypothetical protein, partial [Escherichia coli]|uniref:hypothetical protein n=1 Tax=Escherichia coli TaxID=562 RepID=UPI001BC84F48